MPAPDKHPTRVQVEVDGYTWRVYGAPDESTVSLPSGRVGRPSPAGRPGDPTAPGQDTDGAGESLRDAGVRDSPNTGGPDPGVRPWNGGR